VRPGGVLVYVVCSVLREEGEDVVAALLAARPELEPAVFEATEVQALAQTHLGGKGAPQLRLLPQVHGTDGYFLASLRRKKE
jgi:16S rRNA (cytosine967-C5)-methyltransferase